MHKIPLYLGFFLCLSSAQAIQVLNNNDSGAGSLRFAISNTSAGGQVTFHPSISGETITLTSGELVVNKNLTIDASTLLEGITIDADENSRVFSVNLNTTVTLTSLTMRNGRATGTFPGNLGGGILNQGTLTLQNSTLASCSANANGGGIYNNAGSLSLINSTVAENSANNGGGLYTVGGSTTLLSATISANTATTEGGGVYRLGTQGSVTVTGSIVAGNTAPTLANFSGTINTGSDNSLSGDPMLAPLGIYGGAVPTMHPLPGSPVIDAAGTISFLSADQRGYPRKTGGRVDIGSVETQASIVLNADDDGRGSLREVIEHSFSGDTITFSNTLSGQTVLLTSGQIEIKEDLTIDASALINGINIEGDGSARIFRCFYGSTTTLIGLTLTNGKGAIYNSGELVIRESSITSCSATTGGGIHNEFGAELSLQDSTIALCSSTGSGGGIFNRGLLVLERSTIHSCSATQFASGGGIFSGGLFSNEVASLTLINSTVAQNEATRYGGGIFSGSHSTLTLTNSTITGNTAAHEGGGLYKDAGAISLNARECIIANNSAPTNPNNSGSFNTNFANFTTGDPMLAPLGDYGGPTPTMRPLPGSPVIDNGPVTSGYATDQRGYVRKIGSAVDIGAVEYKPTIVSNTNNSGSGSLRQVIADALYGDVVTFASALSGTTIRLGTQITVQENLEIDASSLPEGITIDGNANSRIFEFTSGYTNILNALTLTNGTKSGTSTSDYGGAIHAQSATTLTIHNCTLFGNSAHRGGAIYSGGSLEIANSTLTGNSAASTTGGGIYSSGSLDLNHVTISDNAVGSNGSPQGGGIFQSLPSINIRNSIVAENPKASLFNNINVPTGGSGNIIDQAAKLAPLGSYGGPTPTMFPLAESPAIDHTSSSTLPTDQRGLARIGAADAGASEYQKASDLVHIWNSDWDGDGNIYGLEHALGTDPLVNDANSDAKPRCHQAGGVKFGFSSNATGDVAWVVERSFDLQHFVEIYRYDGPSGVETADNVSSTMTASSIEVTENETPPQKAFYRFKAEISQ